MSKYLAISKEHAVTFRSLERNSPLSRLSSMASFAASALIMCAFVCIVIVSSLVHGFKG
jgi:hypothetical protein